MKQLPEINVFCAGRGVQVREIMSLREMRESLISFQQDA